MLNNRITFVDLETGGLDSRRHPITQIAAVSVDPAFANYRTFERKIVFDPQLADPKALQINSYDADVWAREAVDEREAASDFAAFLNRSADLNKVSRNGRPYKVAQLAAHNAPFDRGFLFPWFKRLNIYLPAEWHMIDTLQLALLSNSIRGTRPPSLKLVDLCAYYDVPLDDAHDALGDVMATARLARKLFINLAGGNGA